MDGTLVLIMALSGLCFLPSCSPRFYIFVPVSMNWNDAQSYCRSKYTDLAVVETEQELAQLNQLTNGKPSVWIGLRPDTDSWRWSLEDQSHYAAGDTGLREWATGEPNDFGFYKDCVAILKSGNWVDADCTASYTFICYNGSQVTSTSFILVNQSMIWTEAQKYCRLHYTDLASVRNQAENDQLRTVVRDGYTWIGLYRDSWMWSDGSSLSVTNWDVVRAPTTVYGDACVVSDGGKWINTYCTFQKNFACFVVSAIRKQTVQVALKTDSSVDKEALAEKLLKKLIQRLQDQNLNEDIKLRWLEQPDGKVFHRKNTGKQGGGCDFK